MSLEDVLFSDGYIDLIRYIGTGTLLMRNLLNHDYIIIFNISSFGRVH
jgi:hypothetical protein